MCSNDLRYFRHDYIMCSSSPNIFDRSQNNYRSHVGLFGIVFHSIRMSLRARAPECCLQSMHITDKGICVHRHRALSSIMQPRRCSTRHQLQKSQNELSNKLYHCSMCVCVCVLHRDGRPVVGRKLESSFPGPDHRDWEPCGAQPPPQPAKPPSTDTRSPA
jgi:hypothetical protein